MHDVAVALDDHHLVHLLGAKGDDPPDVVAGQIDQHDVLGALLGVLDKLTGQPAVLFAGTAPRPGAGNGTGDDRAVPQANHRLRRRTDHGDLGEPQEVQVRAGVHQPEDPVDVERVGSQIG